MTFLSRSENITRILADAYALANRGLSLRFTVQISPLPESLPLTYTITPAALGPLSLLTTAAAPVSYKALRDYNRVLLGVNFNPANSNQELDYFLRRFVDMGMLTIWTDQKASEHVSLSRTAMEVKDEGALHTHTATANHNFGLSRKGKSHSSSEIDEKSKRKSPPVQVSNVDTFSASAAKISETNAQNNDMNFRSMSCVATSAPDNEWCKPPSRYPRNTASIYDIIFT
jgi:hypothetical protein